ncbi:MAG: branched-chain amino acid ABC transporter permease [Acidimicrobiia bacterium]|nr:branched-chain amino acid ABC transporter permease [Acidimicrobiia bacterium]
MNLVQILILGLLLGGVYALMASGLTLLFGVMRIVNLAHGVFMVIAAYIAFFLFTELGIDPFVSLVVTMPSMFLFGVFVYRLLFTRIDDNDRYSEMTVLLTFGLALVIEGLLGYFFTGIFRSTNPGYATDSFLIGDLFVPKGQLYGALASLVLLVGLWAFLGLTKTGHAIQAITQNRTAAQIVGVNVRRVSTISFGIGMALAGAAGSLLSYLFTFFPGQHWQWIALLLSLIVLGGLGSLKGAVVGSLLLAVLSAFVSNFLGSTWSPMTFYLALFVILLIRPQGLFGEKETV